MSRLLLVDDDRDDVQLTLLGFRDEGFHCDVAVARDGQEALDLLQAAHAAAKPLPEAIVVDLKMPRMDGFELLARLKDDARFRDIPVAVLTSSGHEDDMAEAKRLGAGCYLRKPVNLREYAEIVSRLRNLTDPSGAPT